MSKPVAAAPGKAPASKKEAPTWMLFKIKNPINKFKEVFKKEVDQQWKMAKAALLNLVLTALNLACLYYTQSNVHARMEFEDNEYRRALWGGLFHLLSWVFLCYMRRKYFAIPRLLGYLTFNIFAISYFYTQCYALCANTLGDPNSKMIYATFAFSDAFFAFAYLVLSDYIYPSGFLGFAAFPKFFFAVCFYFWFDDRGAQITVFYIVTNVLSLLQGIHAQELLLDCLDEEITEFGGLDHYALMYLDVPYIVAKTIQGIKIAILEWKDRMYTPKSAADKFTLVDENDEQVEEKKEDKQAEKKKGKKKAKNE